jgi:hypothetical protein
MIPTPSASLGLLKGWRTQANKLLAKSYQFTACNCETINIYIHLLKLGNCPMYECKMPLKYWGMLSSLSGPLGLGRAVETMVVGGRGTCEVAGTKSYKHIHTEVT